ncbi:Pr6Pr family membrane protein [Ruminococcaceae bacterium OttesenSCG-928-A16]|nr:Pr6Pr family membrane protein [Ruminococcaceae bacterium OttesenSCG-928-A16]
MCIKNRLASLIYKIVLVLVAGWGLYLNSGLPQGAFAPGMFKYYTIQSNMLVFLFYICAAVFGAIKLAQKGVKGTNTFAPVAKGAVTMAITVTLLIYQFVLAPGAFTMAGEGALANNLVHLVVPLLVLADWLLFDKKGRYRAGDPFTWLVIPLLYYIYAIIAAVLGVTYHGGSRYPYFFIDADALGWGRSLLNVVVIGAAFLALGYLFWGIDKLLGRVGKPKGHAQGTGQ